MTIRNEFVLIAILSLLLLGLIAAGVEGLPAPAPFLRLLLGLAFVLFAPGYALQAALFPAAEDLDGPERLALSFGLSIAIIPPLALILDGLPWGLRLWPIVAGEGLVMVACFLVTWLRRRRLAEEERFQLAIHVDVKGWWANQDRTSRLIYGILGLALLMAAVGAFAIIALPTEGEFLTEFYILGPEGLAEDYPRETVAGQPVLVSMGIANREAVPATYRVEVREGSELIGQAGPVALEVGASDEREISFAPLEVGDDVKIEFFLYRDDGSEPYRSLRLWMKVKEK
ncbi:MAG: DUF1616 domain-containing protein [Thermoflexales bacterium]|nr:DUF1616 domain-containing protein [Thermoflexales bacterium]